MSECNCNQQFASLVEKVVSDNNLDAVVERVDDMAEIMQYDVMSLPALVVDGKLVAKGKLSEAELVNLLKG
ncbi:MAG: thioredoxin family protein [Candidatus Saccharibacteria bacterium]|nr:thioredoxin family protein [Candidatus Saccharibacteria bacterium]